MPSPRTADLIAAGERLLMANYGRAPVVMSRGEGAVLYDVEGRRYLDMTAGIAVCVLGHGHAGLTRAIADQAARLHHTSNLYFIEEQIRLAEALARRGFGGKAFFCNSGAEANEAALKLARRYQAVVKKEPGRTAFVTFDGSFHGRTMGALSVTGQAKYRDGFGPLVPGARFVPWGDVAAVRAAVGPDTCAVIAEPIQAEGGIRLPPPGFLREVAEVARAAGALVIFDEVQTGVGRTGTFYAYEAENVVPDVVTLAKGLAGGVPMGAMLASDEAARAFEPGSHASTFGGNPLACAAALYVERAIDEQHLLDASRTLGAHLGAALATLGDRHRPKTRGARGRGLLQGLVLEGDAAPVVAAARGRGLLLSAAGGNVVRFAPPLVVGRDQIDEAVETLGGVLAGS